MNVMLCREYKDESKWKALMKSPDWIAEFKRDGNRLQLHYNNGIYQFLNRKGVEYAKEIPEVITKSIEKLTEGDYLTQCVLDGELVYIEDLGDGKVKDHRTQAQCKTAVPYFIVFDCLELNNEDLKDRTWMERKLELFEICKEHEFYPGKANIMYMQHYMQKQEVYNVAEKHKMEGIVLKDVNSKYVDGKSNDWVKIKFSESDDFIVIGYTEASKTSINRKGKTIDNKRYPYFKALVLAQYDKDGKLKPKAQVGGGFKDEDLLKVTPMLNKEKNVFKCNDTSIVKHGLIDKDFRLPLNTINWMREEDWFVVEIKYAELTEYGNPFQPRFLTLRDDKPTIECIEK